MLRILQAADIHGNASLGIGVIPDPEVLFFCVRNRYLIVYRKEIRPLQIIQVLHGARDLAAELRGG